MIHRHYSVRNFSEKFFSPSIFLGTVVTKFSILFAEIHVQEPHTSV